MIVILANMYLFRGGAMIHSLSILSARREIRQTVREIDLSQVLLVSTSLDSGAQ